MCYAIRPNEEQLLAEIPRKRRRDNLFVQQVTEGLQRLKCSPYAYIGRIRKLPKGRYRYRHGRCRIIYRIDEQERTVEILAIRPRDESTYRDL